MEAATAREVLRTFFTQSTDCIKEALDALMSVERRNRWLGSHKDLSEDPNDGVDPDSFGVHQRTDVNVMPYRKIEGYHGRTIYVFQHHLDELLR